MEDVDFCWVMVMTNLPHKVMEINHLSAIFLLPLTILCATIRKFERMIPVMSYQRKKMGLLGAMVCASFLLSACEPGRPLGEDPVWAKDTMPDHFTWLGLGRILSDGKVDIYDPYAYEFDTTPPSFDKPGISFPTFPKNPHYRPSDKDVTFYALTVPADDLDVYDPAPVIEPIPLEK